MENNLELKSLIMEFLNLYLKGAQNKMNYQKINLQIIEYQSNLRWMVSDQQISIVALFPQSLQDQIQEYSVIELLDWEFQVQFTNKTHHLEVLIRVQKFKTIINNNGSQKFFFQNIKLASKDLDISELILLNKKNLLRKHFQFQITQKQLSQKKSLINFIQNDKQIPQYIFVLKQLDPTKLYIIITKDNISSVEQQSSSIPTQSHPTQTETSFPDTLNIHKSQIISQNQFLYQNNNIIDQKNNIIEAYKTNIQFGTIKEQKTPKVPSEIDKRKLENSIKVEDNMAVIKIEARGRPYKTVNNKIWSNKPIIPYDQKLKKEQRIYGSYDQIYNSDAQKKLLTEGQKQHFYDHNMWKRRVGKRASYQKRNQGNDRDMEIEIKDDDDDIDYRGEKAPNLNNLDENQREPRRSDNNKARIIQNLYKKKKRSPHRSYIIVSEAESESDDVSRSRSRKKKMPKIPPFYYNHENDVKNTQSKKEETKWNSTQQTGMINDARPQTQRESLNTYFQDTLDSMQLASNSVKLMQKMPRKNLISQ